MVLRIAQKMKYKVEVSRDAELTLAPAISDAAELPHSWNSRKYAWVVSGGAQEASLPVQQKE